MKKLFIMAKKAILIYCLLLTLTATNIIMPISAEDVASKNCAVFSLEVEVSKNTSATASLLAEEDCFLFVALYDEHSRLLALNGTSVTGNFNQQEIPLVIAENEVEFYYAKSFLWNALDYTPLCQSTISVNPENNSAWDCKGTAYYDAENKQFVLTDDYTAWAVGAIWFEKELQGDFTIDLDYYTGSPNRNLGGGDGIVIAFYANKDYSLVPTLGFTSNGYGIELDTWSNSNTYDPTYNHIALIKDDIGNHCSYAQLPQAKDENWHHLKIVVKDNTCKAYVDGFLKISDAVSMTGYSCLGITAGTGDAVNMHAVKNLLVTY